MSDEQESKRNIATGSDGGRTDVIAVSQSQASDQESRLANAVEAYQAELETGLLPGRPPAFCGYRRAVALQPST